MWTNLDATMPVLAKVSSLIEVLRLGGPYELVYQLWSQFTLTASRMNIGMVSGPALRKAIITNDLPMPGLINVLANIVAVWPLVVS